MEVGARCQACCSDVSDDLALLDARAIARLDPRHMGVTGLNISGVIDDNGFAITAFHPLKGHSTIARGINRRASGCCVVGALVGSNTIQHRMFTF